MTTRDSKERILINLESLLNLSGQLISAKNEKEIADAALLSLMGKLKIGRGAFYLFNASEDCFLPLSVKGKASVEKIERERLASVLARNDLAVCEELEYLGFKRCLPSLFEDETIGFFAFGEKLDGTSIEAEEKRYARLVAIIAANAFVNARNLEAIRERKIAEEKKSLLLRSLFQLSSDFASMISREKILKTLSYNLMGHLLVNKLAVFAASDDDEGEFKEDLFLFKEKIDADILNELRSLEETVLSDEKTFSLKTERWLKANAIKIASPMISGSKKKGLLLIGEKLNRENFTKENLEYVKLLSSTAILSLENESLLRKEIERQKLEKELSIALEIQKKLLPEKNPNLKGYDIAGLSEPTRKVGGDYYDFIEKEDGKLLFAIADVSGKGMPAALLMANVQAAVRALAPLNLDLATTVSRINHIVYRNTESDRFATFFIGELNPKTGAIKYVNAGHNPPMIFRKKSKNIEFLQEGGIVLGIFENFKAYATGETALEPGDFLLAYTDGASEAQNSDGEEYGEEKLANLREKIIEKSASEALELVKSSVREFAGKKEFDDDLTLLAIKAI